MVEKKEIREIFEEVKKDILDKSVESIFNRSLTKFQKGLFKTSISNMRLVILNKIKNKKGEEFYGYSTSRPSEILLACERVKKLSRKAVKGLICHEIAHEIFGITNEKKANKIASRLCSEEAMNAFQFESLQEDLSVIFNIEN